MVVPDFAALHPGYSSARSGGRGRELQRHAIHAVAQAGRLGSIIEDVAEMAAAAVARNSRSRRAEGVVLRFIDGVLERGPEARPSGAAFEFGLRRIERQIAAGAGKCSGAVLFQERTGERPLGPLVPQHLVSIGAQKLAPFLVGMGD